MATHIAIAQGGDVLQIGWTEDAILGDGVLSHMASSLANRCDEILGNYGNAIAWYENVLADPKTDLTDSVFAAIDLGDLYLMMEENGTRGVQGRMEQYIPESKEAHRRQTRLALSMLPNGVEPKTVSKGHHELPDQLWTDIVTEQPEGYVVDANGDVHIYSAEGLAWVSVLSNGLNGQEVEDFAGKTITLEADVDLSAALWTPIAGKSENPSFKPFKGSFDGNGHIVDFVQMIWINGYLSGFFGALFNATITNTTIRNGYFEGIGSVGFLAVQAEKSLIDRCCVECEIHGGYCVPFVYTNSGSTISNSMVYCPLLESSDYNVIRGAFVAENRTYNADTTLPAILNCASIIEQMSWGALGLAGMYNHGLIENCYAYIGEILDYPGWSGYGGPRNGVTADNMGEIRNCYFNRIRDPYSPTGYLDLDDQPVISNDEGTIQDALPFDEEGRGHWKLVNSIGFELENGTVTTDDLLDALNFKIEALNDDDLLGWCDTVSGFDNQQLPVFCGINITELDEDVVENGQEMLYPNPSDGQVTITGNNLKSAEVYNALGQRVATAKGQGEQLTVSLESLPTGIYFVNVTDTDGRRCVKKVVKQ